MEAIMMQMWLKSDDKVTHRSIIDRENEGPICRRDPKEKMRMTSQCAFLLGIVGRSTGILSGMFGVVGGAIIGSAMMSFACRGIQLAIETSL
jgi:uncharacterized membrane protein YfcA